MKKKFRFGIPAYLLSGFLVVGIIIILAEVWFIRAIFFLLLGILGYFLLRIQLNKMERSYLRTVSTNKNQLYMQSIKLVDHMRHDCLNHNQVIMGYIQLQKTEKVIPYLQKWSEFNHRDSKLAYIKVPSLIYYFLSVRSEGLPITCEILIEQELHIHRLSIDQELFSSMIQNVMDYCKKDAGKSFDTKQLYIHFQSLDTAVEVLFRYSGKTNVFLEWYQIHQYWMKQVGVEIDFEKANDEQNSELCIRFFYVAK
jgi:hypothetical protein